MGASFSLLSLSFFYRVVSNNFIKARYFLHAAHLPRTALGNVIWSGTRSVIQSIRRPVVANGRPIGERVNDAFFYSIVALYRHVV